MEEQYLRDRVRHFLAQKAVALSGGDINYNPGLLIGDGKRRPGRPRKVGRPTAAAAKRHVGGARVHKTRVMKPKVHKMKMHKVRKHRGGAVHGNPQALKQWRHFLDEFRAMHPHMPYREAQRMASMQYHGM